MAKRKEREGPRKARPTKRIGGRGKGKVKARKPSGPGKVRKAPSPSRVRKTPGPIMGLRVSGPVRPKEHRKGPKKLVRRTALGLGPDIERKMVRVLKAMSMKKGLVVAFSGGVDSTVVAKLARDALCEKTVAVTADSETLPRSDLEEARELARSIGIEHIVVKHSELDNESVVRNPYNRCYHCKKELSGILKAVAIEKGFLHMADGVNISDFEEHRPGIQASTEAGIWHPFVEFKVTKAELRQMALALGLPVHDKPASACLSSRIPYGETITRDKLAMVEDAEEFLKFLGFRQVRVRHHGDIARIEVPKEMMDYIRDDELRDRIIKRLKELGFRYVTLDLVGYRAGSMDEGHKR